MLKDEINANSEEDLYNGVKKFVKKYSDTEQNIFPIINEFMEALSGGATLFEILQIAKEEMQNPTAVTDITVSNDCELH